MAITAMFARKHSLRAALWLSTEETAAQMSEITIVKNGELIKNSIFS